MGEKKSKQRIIISFYLQRAKIEIIGINIQIQLKVGKKDKLENEGPELRR